MKKNVIDLGTIEFERVISKVEIAEEAFEVSAVTSVENSVSFLKNISNGMSPRAAFCEFAFTMHSEAQMNKAKTKARHVFNTMSDDEALKIMQIVISTNTDAPLELWKLEIKDIYERFEVYIKEYAYLSTREMVDSINTLTVNLAKQIVTNCSLGFAELLDKLVVASSNMMSSLVSSFAGISDAVEKYYEGRVKLDPVMREFGWGGFSALPGHIIQYINANKSELSESDVDGIMLDYYKNSNYKELNCLLNNWWENPFFSERKLVFLEAFECYKHNYHIACFTLLTIHLEGIIKSYLYKHINMDSTNKISLDKFIDIWESISEKNIAYFHDCSRGTLREIYKRLTDHFEMSKPGEASNLSRHKNMHGQMFEEIGRTEVLKTWLYLGELKHLLDFLLKNYQTKCNNT